MKCKTTVLNPLHRLPSQPLTEECGTEMVKKGMFRQSSSKINDTPLWEENIYQCPNCKNVEII